MGVGASLDKGGSGALGGDMVGGTLLPPAVALLCSVNDLGESGAGRWEGGPRVFGAACTRLGASCTVVPGLGGGGGGRAGGALLAR